MVDIREIMKKYGFQTTKSLGQNFLKDEDVLLDIVNSAQITKDDTIVEIGPGIGVLTRELLKRAKDVYAIELDDRLIPVLDEELKDFNNLDIINADALKFDYNEIIQKEPSVKLVANLPYYVTTPIISKILLERYNFKSITIMIQKEVGERIAAKPDTSEYGSLSLLVQYFCDAEIIRNVSRYSFIPSPKVESIVLKLTKLESPRVKVQDEKMFFDVIRKSFNMRRKTLKNALSALKLDKDKLESAFKKTGIDPKRRGETLSIQEFAELADAIGYVLKEC